MNKFTFKKSIGYFFKFLFVMLAIGALSFTAQAGALDGQEAQQSLSELRLDLDDGQGEVLQSVQPTCGKAVGNADDVAISVTPQTNTCQMCCFGGYACCDDCRRIGFTEDGEGVDAS